MSSPSDPLTLTMHGLRLKGFAEADAVAEAVGLDPSEVVALLDQLLAEELATYRDGRISGFTLTANGRTAHAARLADELDATATREPVHGAYRDFLVLNPDLLAVCTAWQLREVDGESTVNDHSDGVYDAEVIEQLTSLHAKAEPILDRLAECLARYRTYGPKLTHALQKVRTGEPEWFTKPIMPSYHTVWFELHEDLLATLGIDRGSEVAG